MNFNEFHQFVKHSDFLLVRLSPLEISEKKNLP